MTKPQAGLTDSEIDQILDNLDATGLNDWERKFVESVSTWWKKSRKLSEKQSKRLAEMWRKQHEPR